jgi:hypothetical protein
MTSRLASCRLALLSCAIFIEGCKGSEGSQQQPSHVEGDGAVVVDFYGDEGVSAACSGTLVSPLVVLTAAHCADGSNGARVTVAGASSSTAEVADVFVYDWGDDVAHHAQEHDLALLILRQPLHAGSYARVSTDEALGQDVSIVGRSSRDGAWGVDAIRTDRLRLSTDAPTGRPFAALVAARITDAGGAVRRADGAVVGVVMGQGKDSGAGYVGRVDDPLIQPWVDAVVALADRGLSVGDSVESAATPQGAIHPAALSAGSQTFLQPGDGDLTGTDPEHLVGDPELLITPAKLASGGGRSSAPQPYGRAAGIQVVPEAGQLVQRGSNYWLYLTPGDRAFDYDSQLAATHPEASFIIAHGNTGLITGLPPMSEIRALYESSGGAIIIDACFGGKVSRGTNNAGAIARAAGIPPEAVYGCSGEESTSDAMHCDGQWVDGNGRPVGAPQRGDLLLNCKMVHMTGGNIPQSCY